MRPRVKSTTSSTRLESDVEFVAGLQAEAELVEHGAGRPGLGVDAGDADKAHASRFGHHPQDGRHRADSLHRCDVGGDGCIHQACN
jgi:hypothetical protein